MFFIFRVTNQYEADIIKPGRTVDSIKQDDEIITFCERGLIFSAFFFFSLVFDMWTSEIYDTVVFLLTAMCYLLRIRIFFRGLEG